MKKVKKQMMLAFVAICLIASVALFACSKGGSVKMVDFADATIECDYGSVYTLETSPAKDEKGNEYPVTAVVTDADDKRVAVFDNKFDVLDLRGYTIKYSAISGEEVIAERTVTITVKATAKPTLVLSEINPANTFEIGDPFKLPAYTASSPLTSDLTVTAKLVLKGDPDEEITGISDNKFTPTKAGKYEYSISVDDGLGNVVSDKKEFSIRTAPVEGEIESFDNAVSEYNATGASGMQVVQYVSSDIGGKEGSIKLLASANWPRLLVRPRQELVESVYPYISFKIYIDGTGLSASHKSVMTLQDGNEIYNLVAPNKWTEIIADTHTFNSKVSESADGYGDLFFFMTDGVGAYREKDDITCYITDIKGVKNNEPKEEDSLFDFSDSSVFNQIGNGGIVTGNPTKYVLGCELVDLQLGDTKAVMKASRIGTNFGLGNSVVLNRVNLYVKPTRDKEYYKDKGYTHISIPLRMVEGTNAGNQMGLTIFRNSAGANGRSETVYTDKWTNLEIDIDTFFANANSDGFIEIFTIWGVDGNLNINYAFYVGDIKAVERVDISFSAIPTTNTYNIGDPFTLPTYTVNRAQEKDYTATAKLVLKGDPDEEITEISENKFTPNKNGRYEYTVTVTDGNKFLGSATVDFSIRNAAAEGEIESFDDALSAYSVKGGMEVEYVSSDIGGIAGSFKLHASTNWPHLWVKPRQQLSESEYPYISFKIYIDGTGLKNTHKSVVTYFKNGSSNKDVFTLVAPNQWTEVFLDTVYFNGSLDAQGYGDVFYFMNDGNGAYRDNDDFTSYVTDIKGVKNNEAKEEDSLFDFSDSSVLAQIGNGRAATPGGYVLDCELVDLQLDDTKALMKISRIGTNVNANRVNLYVKPTQNAQYYKDKGYTHISIPLRVVEGTNAGDQVGLTIFRNSAGANGRSETVYTDKWTNLEIDIDTFFANANGEGFVEIFTIWGVDGNLNVNYAFYVGDIKAVTKD